MGLVRNLILLLFVPFLAHSQIKNIGTPNIQNYPKSVYKAGTQNWDVAQDKNGFMYFANNDGVLKFDGFHWDLLNVPLSLVRSVMVDSKNRIIIGLLYDFGMLEQDDSGNLSYRSLLELVPKEDRGFNDVWKIYEINGNIIFQSYEKMFIYDGRKIHTINPKDKFHFSFKINKRLLIQDSGEGLFELYGSYIDKLPWSESLKDFEILSIIEIEGNRLLIGTAQNGVFYYSHGKLSPWNTEVNEFIKINKLFNATIIESNLIAFGTILNGVVITNENGEILQHLNRSTGLLNNTILSLFADKDKNLWLGLDNGINYVEINSPTSYITDKGEIGTGYCCQIFDGKLYVGTNQGLFVKPFNNFLQNNERFSLVENSEGQVWSLGVFDGQLICGHNAGTYTVLGETATKVSNEPGAWRYIRLKNNKDILLGGNYNGLVILKRGVNGWEYKDKVKGFSESSRFLFQGDGDAIWMSHGGKGIFKIELNTELDSVANYSLYKQADGLPSDKQNIQFQLEGKNYISTISGIYKYNSTSGSFVVADEINELFGVNGRIKTVEIDENDNIWYISQNESGVLRKNEDLTYTKIINPFKALSGTFVSEFEFIYPYNNDHIIFGIDKGFAHYSSKFPKSYVQDYQSYITKVELSYIDSVVLVRQDDDLSFAYEFPYKRNSLRFHFAAPFYENLIDLRFSYFLESYSEKWSEWTADSYKDFTNLTHGKYRFKVKAINNYGVESDIREFNFVILPPWYQSSWAYAFYIFTAFLIFFSVIVFIRSRIRESEESEKIKHEKELREKEEAFKLQSIVAEKEIIKLRNDKLRSEMIHRDKELANQTNSIIQKNKFLRKLNDELKLLQNTTDDASVKTKIAIIKKRISKETENKQQKVFETYFDKVHEAFFDRLKEKFPQLSPKDLRLCAYVRMNISTKEIATLLNISDRGVEITRYRLRKKLELSREINLSIFLTGV